MEYDAERFEIVSFQGPLTCRRQYRTYREPDQKSWKIESGQLYVNECTFLGLPHSHRGWRSVELEENVLDVQVDPVFSVDKQRSSSLGSV